MKKFKKRFRILLLCAALIFFAADLYNHSFKVYAEESISREETEKESEEAAIEDEKKEMTSEAGEMEADKEAIQEENQDKEAFMKEEEELAGEAALVKEELLEEETTQKKEEADSEEIKLETDSEETKPEADPEEIRLETDQGETKLEDDPEEIRTEADQGETKSEDDLEEIRLEADQGETKTETDQGEMRAEAEAVPAQNDILEKTVITFYTMDADGEYYQLEKRETDEKGHVSFPEILEVEGYVFECWQTEDYQNIDENMTFEESCGLYAVFRLAETERSMLMETGMETRASSIGISTADPQVGQQNRYEYSGSELMWTVASSGYYKITCAGAKGGDGVAEHGNVHYSGDAGGVYYVDRYKLSKGDTVVIHCGGRGGDGDVNDQPGVGGYSDGSGGSTMRVSPHSTSSCAGHYMFSGGGGGSSYFSVNSMVVCMGNGGNGGKAVTCLDGMNDSVAGGAGGGSSVGTYIGTNTGNGYVVIELMEIKADPAVRLSAAPSGWTKSNVTLTAETASSINVPASYLSWNGGVWTGSNTYTVTRNGTYTCKIRDAEGDTGTESITVSNIDKLAPRGSIAASTPAWTKGNAILTVTAADAAATSEYGKSGLPTACYSWKKDGSGNPIWMSENSYSVTKNGTYKCLIRDNAGNETETSVEVRNIDRLAPRGSIAASMPAWTKGNVTLTVTAADAAATSEYGKSGLPTACYSWKKDGSGNPIWTSENSYSVTKNGTYKCLIRDNAGNETETSIEVRNIDKMPPEAELTADMEEWTIGSVTLTVTSADAAATSEYGKSGLPTACYSWEKDGDGNTIWTDESSYEASQNGTYKCLIRDNAGNETETSVEVRNIDRLAPLAEVIADTEEWTNGSVTLIVTAEDMTATSEYGKSGLPTACYSWEKDGDGNTIWTDESSYEASQNGTYKCLIRDNAGNETETSVEVGNIDKMPPEAELTADTEEWTNGSVTLTVTAEDAAATSEYVAVTSEDAAATSEYGKSGLPMVCYSWEKDGDGNPIWTSENSYNVLQNGTYKCLIRDKAGNETETSIEVRNIDKMPPEAELTADTEEWTNRSVTLTVTAEDAAATSEYVAATSEDAAETSEYGKSGLPTACYSWKKDGYGNPIWTDESSYEASQNGTYKCLIRDNAGNETETSIEVTNIDKLPPEAEVTADTEEWTNGSVTLTVTAEDMTATSEYGKSGFPEACYSWEKDGDGDPIWTDESSYNVLQNGTYKCLIRDKAGNETERSVEVSNIDRLASELGNETGIEVLINNITKRGNWQNIPLPLPIIEETEHQKDDKESQPEVSPSLPEPIRIKEILMELIPPMLVSAEDPKPVKERRVPVKVKEDEEIEPEMDITIIPEEDVRLPYIVGGVVIAGGIAYLLFLFMLPVARIYEFKTGKYRRRAWKLISSGRKLDLRHSFENTEENSLLVKLGWLYVQRNQGNKITYITPHGMEKRDIRYKTIIER